MILEEDFIGKKLNVSHCTIFGNLRYCHILGDRCTNLDQTTKRGYFVGYSQTSKTYRIFIHMTKIIIVRHDVKFMEDKSFIRSRDFPVDDQCKRPIEAQRPSQGKQNTSTVTSISVGLIGDFL